MRKTLLILLLVAALLLLLLPAAVGLVAERQAARALATVAAQHESLSLGDSEFQRGWFRSESVHRLRIGAAGGPYELVIESTYRHGPLPEGERRPGLARLHSTFSLENAATGARWPLPGEAETWLRLGGGGESRLTLPSLRWDADRGYGALDWDDGEITVAFNGRLSRVQLQGRIGRLRVRHPEGSLDLDRLRVTADRHQRRGQWRGSVATELARMSIWSRAYPRTSTDLVRLDAEANGTGHRDGLVDLDGRVDADGFRWRGQQTRDPGFAGEATRLDADGLRELAALARDALEGRLTMPALGPRLRPALDALLGNGPAVAVRRLHGNLPMGRLEAELDLQLPEVADTANATLLRVALGAEAMARLLVPGQLVDMARADPRVGGATELALTLGVLAPHGNAYRTDLRYREGELDVNGMRFPVPVDALLGQGTANASAR